jgi:alpha-ketoglutarate-dependent taurine dioxygenase
MTVVAEADAMSVKPLTPLIGSEVKLPRSALIEGTFAPQIRSLLRERGVLVFPKVDLSDDEMIAFANTIGPIFVEVGEGVMMMSLDKNDTQVSAYLRASQFWHIDNVSRGIPNFASMLSARALPDEGGETEFANMYAAWEGLPADQKASLEGLRVNHSFESFQRRAIPDPTSADLESWLRLPTGSVPLVWHHNTGRTSLVLGSSAYEIIGRDPAEGRLLLCRLTEFATQPQYVYRHTWSLGDLVVWDNTGTMHRARPFAEGATRRLGRLATVGEEELV